MKAMVATDASAQRKLLTKGQSAFGAIDSFKENGQLRSKQDTQDGKLPLTLPVAVGNDEEWPSMPST